MHSADGAQPIAHCAALGSWRRLSRAQLPLVSYYALYVFWYFASGSTGHVRTFRFRRGLPAAGGRRAGAVAACCPAGEQPPGPHRVAADRAGPGLPGLGRRGLVVAGGDSRPVAVPVGRRRRLLRVLPGADHRGGGAADEAAEPPRLGGRPARRAGDGRRGVHGHLVPRGWAQRCRAASATSSRPRTSPTRCGICCKSTIALSHALGVPMVAEGVEDQITCDVLAGFGCDIAQGYHLARPMPAAQLAHWLEQRTTLARGSCSSWQVSAASTCRAWMLPPAAASGPRAGRAGPPGRPAAQRSGFGGATGSGRWPAAETSTQRVASAAVAVGRQARPGHRPEP